MGPGDIAKWDKGLLFRLSRDCCLGEEGADPGKWTTRLHSMVVTCCDVSVCIVRKVVVVLLKMEAASVDSFKNGNSFGCMETA